MWPSHPCTDDDAKDRKGQHASTSWVGEVNYPDGGWDRGGRAWQPGIAAVKNKQPSQLSCEHTNFEAALNFDLDFVAWISAGTDFHCEAKIEKIEK